MKINRAELHIIIEKFLNLNLDTIISAGPQPIPEILLSELIENFVNDTFDFLGENSIHPIIDLARFHYNPENNTIKIDPK